MKSVIRNCSIVLLLSPVAGLAEDENVSEMVVTATRTEKAKVDLPLAIDKVTSEEINQDLGSHISESLNSVAGVHINQLSAGSSPAHNTAIRMPMNYGPYYLFLQDNVPVQSPGSFNHNALWWTSYSTSVSSIEVIKGPGTALYGSDAVAGTINVISEGPSENPEKAISYTTGEYGYNKLRASVGATTESGQGFRIAASHEAGDGWREKADYERSEVLLRHDVTTNKDQNFKTIFTANTMSGHNQKALTEEQLEEDRTQHGFDDDSIDPYRETDSFRLSTEWTSYPSDQKELTVIPYFTRYTNDYVATWVETLPENETTSDAVGLLAKLALDHQGGSESILGIDVVTNRESRSYVQSMPDTVIWGTTYLQGQIYDYEVDYLGIAPYVQHNRQLGEKTQLSAGLRYDQAKFDYENNLSDGMFGAYQRPADRTDSFENLSPKLGLTYKFTKDSAVYARYARAFRIPQAGTLYALKAKNAESALDPETADSFETGYKKESRVLSVELAAYVMKIKDAIVTDSTDPGATFKTNAGRITHKGIEASVGWRMTDSAAINIAYAVPRSEYDEFVSSGKDYSGNKMKMGPEHIGNVSFRFTPTSIQGLSAELEWQDIGSWWMDDANTKEDGGYDIVNLRAIYAVTEKLAINAKVLNIADREYVSQSEIAWGREQFTPGSPRIAYAGIDYRF